MEIKIDNVLGIEYNFFVVKQKYILCIQVIIVDLAEIYDLIPIHPLDGGRTAAAISPWLWGIGIPIGVVYLFIYPNPVLVLILILGVIQIIDQIKSPDKEYYEVRLATRVKFAAVYFGLMALLGIGMTYIHGIHSSFTIG